MEPIYSNKKNGAEVYAQACERARQCLIAEIEQLNEWLGGQVFGYVLEGPDGERLDSLWGMYGLDYATEEANRVLEAYAEQARSGC